MSKYYVQCGPIRTLVVSASMEQASLEALDESLQNHLWIYDDPGLSNADCRNHLMLEALVDEGTLDAVEAAIEANDQHDEKITELGDLWRFAEAEGEDDAHIRLQAFERQLGDEFDWEWWERQVFAEHAKQWAADALDMCDLMDDLLIWCKLAAPSASVSLIYVAVFEAWSRALPRLTDSLMTVWA